MENKKIKITEKKWNDINDEISEILEIFLENISHDISEYDTTFEVDFDNRIYISDIDLNQDNEIFMSDFQEIMSNHFKLNEKKIDKL
jgi:hypothetical protein